MKRAKRILSLLTVSVCLSGFMGCTMISYDRVFPKLTWAWTDQAKEQRRQDRERKEGEKAYRDSLRTNAPAKGHP